MIVAKRKQTNPPADDLDASFILECLINADSCLLSAAHSAMDAQAYTLGAELNNVRCRIVEQVYALMHDRKELVGLMTPAAQRLFREFVDRSSVKGSNGEN